MNSVRKSLKNLPIIQSLSSVKIAVACLLLLFILTLWGTVAQVQQGLYLSQERFFYSWYFLAAGWLPFPGAKLVLWVMFINLVCVSITRFVYKWSHLGIVIIHIGLLSYFAAAFVTYQCTEESNVTLLEGESTNLSSSYHDWELSVWQEEKDGARQVHAIDVTRARPQEALNYESLALTVTVKSYYPNAKAYIADPDGNAEAAKNDSGIKSLVSAPFETELEKNVPGGVFAVADTSVLLYGGESQATTIEIAGQSYYFQLRRKRFELPFEILLKEFKMQVHPGTEIARSYESFVKISHDQVERETRIFMNNPLRFRDYTLFQASYSIDTKGRERSTFAVVKNIGRWFPYASSLITFLGLAVHFLAMAFKPRTREVK